MVILFGISRRDLIFLVKLLVETDVGESRLRHQNGIVI